MRPNADAGGKRKPKFTQRISTPLVSKPKSKTPKRPR